MNNWINRLAIFAVVGAILSSTVLVGCGSKAEDDTAGNGPAMANAAPEPADGGG